MAKGLLRHVADDHYEVTSAGTHPAGLNPDAVEAMREIGIDISHHRSKRIDEFLNRRFDDVITVCHRARESCPVFPEASSALHWNLDDPAEAQGSGQERRAAFRRVRDELHPAVKRLMDERKPA